MKNYISEYEQYLIDQAKSSNTILTYVTDVKKFFEKHDVINRETIQEFKKEIADLSTKTINKKLSSLKSFNEFLLDKGVVDSLYIIKKDFIKIQQQGNPTDVSEKQVAMFLKRVNEKDCMYKSRNIALVNLIANTGIRREEACNIKLKNLDLDNGELIVVGKGNKQRTVLLNDQAIEVIKNYLVDRSKMKHADSPYLFITDRSDKLHKDSVNDIFDFYSTPKCRVKPHSLRRNYATVTQEQGVLTLPELQNQLGHDSVATTGIYAQARKSNIRKKINKLQIS